MSGITWERLQAVGVLVGGWAAASPLYLSPEPVDYPVIPSVPASVFLAVGVLVLVSLARAVYDRVFRTERASRDERGGDLLGEIRSLNEWPNRDGDPGDVPDGARDPDVVACPNCLARNDPEYEFCRECAAELPS